MVNSEPSKYQLATTQIFVIMRLTPRNKCSDLTEREGVCEHTPLNLFYNFNIRLFSSYYFLLSSVTYGVFFLMKIITIFEMWNNECLESKENLPPDKMKDSTYILSSF